MVKSRRPAGPLRTKMYRDLADGWKSFVAILIICLLSTALFMGFDLTWRGMDQNIRQQFALGNLADIWVRGEISGNDARKLEMQGGVLSAQKRVTAEGEADDLPGDPQIRLLMSEGEPAVNKPVIYAGEGFTPGKKDQCILQKRFADANHLTVGDSITVTVSGQKLSLAVCGLGTLPEFVIYNKEGEAVTIAASYGYAIVSPGTLGFLPYSEVSLTIKPDADAKDVRRAVQNVVDKDRTTVTLRADKAAVKESMEQISQLRMIGLIVPLLFFLVAALITWTTMGRLVENQRTQLGSLFAMGYGRRTILMHYAEYGVFIAILGALLGFVGAEYGLSPLLLWFLQTVYIMPGAAPFLSVPTMIVITLALVLITGGAAVLSARNALTKSPADLLRPRPPKKAKKIFLERIPLLWNRLSFSGKVIARSMLRSRVRLLMGLVGTIGCTALMLIGFGLRDTVEYAKWNYYTNTLAYDARVTLTRDAPEGYAKSVQNRTGAVTAEEEMITALDVYLGGDWKEKPVFVLENGQQLIHLEDESGGQIELPPSGVTVTRKMADEFHLQVGDMLRLHMNGKRDIEASVTQIVNLEMGQGLYFSREAWRKLELQPFSPTAVLLHGGPVDLAKAKDMDGVDRVQTLTMEYEDSNTMLKTLNLVVLLLIAFSGGLALVVYYNLGQLNYSERIRELATLKVLGFLPGEMKKIVLRENIIVTCLGLPFGFAAGVFLHRIVMEYALPSSIQFVQHIELSSSVLIALITVGFSLIVNLILGSKFKSINMVEALKSVE